MTVGHLYCSRSSSNHFMKVKQPVYERSSRSGRGSGLPFGARFPFAIIPRSAFT